MKKETKLSDFFDFFNSNVALITLVALISSCNEIIKETQIDSVRRNSANTYAGTNQALIYPDNPVALRGKFTTNDSFSKFLTAGYITDNPFLETSCNFNQYSPDIFNPSVQVPLKDTTKDECLAVLNDTNASTTILKSKKESWVFENDSDEFFQVNTFYHLKSIMDRYLSSISFAHKYVHLQSNVTIPPATKFNFIDTQSYLLTEDGLTKTLKAYSKCYLELNAYFSPAQDILCFGYNEKGFRLVQDPSIIYHEMGHVFVKAMMNQRNVTSGVDPNTSMPYFKSHPYQSDLGELYYDEAGAINEAIADYFSYYMNQRTRVGEFVFNKIKVLYEEPEETRQPDDPYFSQYRPLSENEGAHGIELSESSGKRLSYPQHVHYDPANPTKPIEDVHFSSGTVSHYLVALTKELKNSCSYSTSDKNKIHAKATDYVILLINETLAEVGDLTAKGSDMFSEYSTFDTNQENLYFTNLNNEQSYLWTQVVNPPNFRRFFRIFGKNIYHYITNGLCPGFSIDESESLLDDYGLLLFKSYEDRGNGLDTDTLAATIYSTFTGLNLFSGKPLMPFSFNTQVNEDNRKNSVLIAKDFLELDSDSVAFIIDGQNDMKNILANLVFEGENVATTEGIAGTEYNNNNVKISPGEVVAISLNLFNNSNSTMGGVQFLANDWDHMKLNDLTKNYTNKTSNKNASRGIASYSPCSINGFPSASEGGVTDTITTTQGNCSHTSKTNKSIDTSEVIGSTIFPKYDLDSPQPICMVQYSDENETKWVSQDFFRTYDTGLEDSDCLNNPSMSGENFNPNECLMRFLPGAAQGVLGKIDSQKTWSETITNDGKTSFSFDAGHLAVMEVNKWIEPGTKFNCRFRVRFSNCSDCFDEFKYGDPASSLKDYSDYEFIGDKPYKVINLQFTVLD